MTTSRTVWVPTPGAFLNGDAPLWNATNLRFEAGAPNPPSSRVVLAADAAAGAGFADLLSTTLTLGNGAAILAVFSAAGEKTVALGSTYFQFLLDGVQVGPIGAMSQNIGFRYNWFFHTKMIAAAGLHTVKVQWKVDAGGSTINVLTDPILASFAELTLEQVRA